MPKIKNWFLQLCPPRNHFAADMYDLISYAIMINKFINPYDAKVHRRLSCHNRIFGVFFHSLIPNCMYTLRQSSFNTARNAFCGTSTDPICFMRFLPFFCFSSNFRFRLISPP